MDKFIRGEVKLNSEEIRNIELSFQYLGHEKYPLEEISKEIKLKDGKKSNLKLRIKQEKEQTYLEISYLDEIIFLKECYLSIRDVIGIYLLKKVKGYIFLINIDYNYPAIKYYDEKLSILKFKKHDDTRELYNQIMYYDFANENELLMATYCLFLLLPYSSECIYAFDLYEQKLNYIGYNIKDFYNKDNKYSFNEVELMIKETNSPKDLLTYLIGLVTSIKKFYSEHYIGNVCTLFKKYFSLKFS